ncbi:MAG: CoA transferase [Burkholderiaceae bacterium]
MQALAGIKVLELGQLIAGPFAGKTLADFGADVIKIEPEGGGDPLRKWRLLREGTSVWWEVQSRNKRSVCVDLRSDAGKDVVRRLAREADVVIENFKPGTLEGWGLGWEQLHALNPRLIMLRISGFGQTGPYDATGLRVLGEAMGGLRHERRAGSCARARPGIDQRTLAALHGVIGVLLALRHAIPTAARASSSTSRSTSVFNVMEEPAARVRRLRRSPRTRRQRPARHRAHQRLSLRGRQYVLVAGNGDSIYRRLMTAIGRADLADDPDLAHNDGRARRAAEIDAAIEAWTSQRSREQVLETLEGANVPVGRIYSIADIAADPQYRAREMIVETRDADGRPLKVPGIVPKLSATPGRIAHSAPRLGEHNEECLGATGWPARAGSPK